MAKTFIIAFLACAIFGTAAVSAAQQQQPLVMPAGQKPEEWKFKIEKEAEANQTVEDKKAAKKKAEEDKKAAAEAKKKAEAERKLAAKAAREETEKKRADERRAAADKKKSDEAQRAADARAEREAGASKREADAAQRAEEQKAADERRALERRAAAEKSAGDAKSADGAKPAVDPVRPPAVIRSGEQPDAWKMSSEKPRGEGAAGQGRAQAGKGKSSDGKSSDAKSSDAKSASATTGQTKPASSSAPKPKEPWRGWSDRALISLNAGWQTASFDLRDTRNFDPAIPGDREQRTLAADYSVKSGVSLDLGGGVRVWRALAAGVSVTRFEDSRDVPVSGTVPHPFFFNRSRAFFGTTTGAREEMAVHVDAMWVVPIRRNMTLAIFGGPSFYSVKQTVVSDYDYNQSYPYDDVTLTRVVAADESSSVTGINVGADVGYYFTNTIGVGGVIRFGRASVDTSIGSIDVGGPEFGVGLRIRIPQGRPRTR